MDKDPRKLAYFMPNLPAYVIVHRVSRWYAERMLSLLLDLLRATDHVAIHRDLLSPARRSKIPPKKQIRLGKRVYYILRRSDLPDKWKLHPDLLIEKGERIEWQ